ncbi:hypothetical protein AM027 [Anaplasma marginale str. St. Maries]|nr:hypothetical protein AM027 [Anaplasma marginale str. St. Maries]
MSRWWLCHEKLSGRPRCVVCCLWLCVMPSFTGVLFLAVFGIVLYVLLTYAVNQFTAWIGKRNRDLREKSSAPWGSASAVLKRTSSTKPPQRQFSPYMKHGATAVLPKSVIGVEAVSQVFVSSNRGRGR